MKNLGLRVGLMLIGAAALAGAAFKTWTIEQDKQAAAVAAQQVDDRLRGLMLTVMDIRVDQQSYVAAGQGSAFWAEKVTQVLNQFDKEVAALRPRLRAPDALAALDAAGGAIDTFRKMDFRAREYAHGGQELLASDLIFTDGFEMTTSALSQVDATRVAEATHFNAQSSALTKVQRSWLGAAAGICLFVLLVLTPRASVEAESVEPLRDLVPQPPVDAVIREPARAASPAADWMAAADVCAGLARVLESSELTALLGRVAHVLNASGVIVWVADRSGAELRPALAHGYTNQTLSRMGLIARDGHNAVAAAYRTGTTRTVTGDDRNTGAIVAPIVSPGGCLGVLAAEVRRGGEQSDALKAIAMVFASQLGTLVSSVPADIGLPAAQTVASS
jgi:GAF domain-containing protein